MAVGGEGVVLGAGGTGGTVRWVPGGLSPQYPGSERLFPEGLAFDGHALESGFLLHAANCANKVPLRVEARVAEGLEIETRNSKDPCECTS